MTEHPSGLTHELKTDPNAFELSFAGLKPWEIRFNDRDFQVGQRLVLRETLFSAHLMAEGAPLIYTGRRIICRITCVFDGPQYGLAPEWCILSVEKEHQSDASPAPELEAIVQAFIGYDVTTDLRLAVAALDGFIKSSAQSRPHQRNAFEEDECVFLSPDQALSFIHQAIEQTHGIASECGRAFVRLRDAVSCLSDLSADPSEPWKEAPPPGKSGQWLMFLIRRHNVWQQILDEDPDDDLAQQEMNAIEEALLAIREQRSGPF